MATLGMFVAIFTIAVLAGKVIVTLDGGGQC